MPKLTIRQIEAIADEVNKQQSEINSLHNKQVDALEKEAVSTFLGAHHELIGLVQWADGPGKGVGYAGYVDSIMKDYAKHKSPESFASIPARRSTNGYGSSNVYGNVRQAATLATIGSSTTSESILEDMRRRFITHSDLAERQRTIELVS